MTREEEKRYMEGELHLLFHNQTEGWVPMVKPAGEEKWRRSNELRTAPLRDLQDQLTPLLSQFPHRLILIFYSTELDMVRIRFHPQENENGDFYNQMMTLINSQIQ